MNNKSVPIEQQVRRSNILFQSKSLPKCVFPVWEKNTYFRKLRYVYNTALFAQVPLSKSLGHLLFCHRSDHVHIRPKHCSHVATLARWLQATRRILPYDLPHCNDAANILFVHTSSFKEPQPTFFSRPLPGTRSPIDLPRSIATNLTQALTFLAFFMSSLWSYSWYPSCSRPAESPSCLTLHNKSWKRSKEPKHCLQYHWFKMVLSMSNCIHFWRDSRMVWTFSYIWCSAD